MEVPLIFMLLGGGKKKTVKKEKIIFLDIDGVLNRHSYDTHLVLENDLVENLKNLLEKTGAKIVLSTFWRGFPDYIKFIFGSYDISYDTIIGVTPGEDKAKLGNIYKSEVRSNQILDWLEENGSMVESYLILDDREYAAIGRKQKDRFIKTNTKLGFTDDLIEEAVQILKTPYIKS